MLLINLTYSLTDFNTGCSSKFRFTRDIHPDNGEATPIISTAKDPDTKKRLKRAYEYAKERKEASKKKTARMKKN